MRAAVTAAIGEEAEQAIFESAADEVEYMCAARAHALRATEGLASMTDTKLRWDAPIWKPFRDEDLEKEARAREDTVPITTQNVCPRCESNRTVQVEKQVRATDEPSTVFITCVACKNKWKIN